MYLFGIIRLYSVQQGTNMEYSETMEGVTALGNFKCLSLQWHPVRKRSKERRDGW